MRPIVLHPLGAVGAIGMKSLEEQEAHAAQDKDPGELPLPDQMVERSSLRFYGFVIRLPEQRSGAETANRVLHPRGDQRLRRRRSRD